MLRHNIQLRASETSTS